jgi:hypothetical protein
MTKEEQQLHQTMSDRFVSTIHNEEVYGEE